MGKREREREVERVGWRRVSGAIENEETREVENNIKIESL